MGNNPHKRGMKIDYGFSEPTERPFDTKEETAQNDGMPKWIDVENSKIIGKERTGYEIFIEQKRKMLQEQAEKVRAEKQTMFDFIEDEDIVRENRGGAEVFMFDWSTPVPKDENGNETQEEWEDEQTD